MFKRISLTQLALTVMFGLIGLIILVAATQSVSASTFSTVCESLVCMGWMAISIYIGVIGSRQQQVSETLKTYAEEEAIGSRTPVNQPVSKKDIRPHVLIAIGNARLDPLRLLVLPVDMGLIAYHGKASKKIYRTRPIPNDCDYIQPFVQLRFSDSAVRKVRFEIVDAKKRTIFSREDSYKLEQGGRLVTPPSRLPIDAKQDFSGRWALLIYVDDMLIAKDVFTWIWAKEIDFDESVGEDGEITNELAAVLDNASLQDMSLDELLEN